MQKQYFSCLHSRHTERSRSGQVGKSNHMRPTSVFAKGAVLLCAYFAGRNTIEAKERPSDYQDQASLIINSLTRGAAKGQAWHRLAELTDTIGNRVSGSQNLRDAVIFILKRLKADGLENVHGEEAVVPYWVRGEERCTMLSPRHGYRVSMLGLGTSVGTPPEGITAQVVVVETFDELTRVDARGKIVLFNQQCDWEADPIGCYGKTGRYRADAASKAAAHGAVAALVRSLASFSIASPHTGHQSYAEGVVRIPAAAVSLEDADAMARMQARGQNITLHLYMEAKNLPDEVSHNVVAELTGSEYPEQVVLLSGHLDSWDVGVGAMDDGGGAIISWQALSTLRQLGLRPKRTLRLVLWTCEEFGGVGSHQYYLQHRHEADNMTLVMESDMGVFRPNGLTFTGPEAATAVMKDVVSLLNPINATSLSGGGYETDTGPWQQDGVPGASLASDNARYFWYHHSQGDQMQVLNRDDMDLASAVFAITAFVIADLDEPLPRK